MNTETDLKRTKTLFEDMGLEFDISYADESSDDSVITLDKEGYSELFVEFIFNKKGKFIQAGAYNDN